MKLVKALLAAAGAAVLAACTSQGAAPNTHPVPGPVLTPASTKGAPFTGVFETNSAASFGLVRRFAHVTGARPSIVEFYSGWWAPFNAALASDAHSIGAVPLIQFDPQGASVSAIAAGHSDPYLRSYAAAVRSFAHPVILSFGHEMNGSWYSWGHGHTSPSVFTAAWRHVVTVFRDAGAANVTWLWTVNVINHGSPPLLDWWPGASYVNWVGADGYFYYPSDTFASVFGGTLTELRQITRDPVLITETAAGPSPRAASQVRGLFAGVRANRLLGLVWFDKAQHHLPFHQDWHLEDDPAALAAYRAAVKEYR